MGAINSMQRDPGLSSADRAMGLFAAGASGYAMGKDLQSAGAKDITSVPQRSYKGRRGIRGGRSFSGAKLQ